MQKKRLFSMLVIVFLSSIMLFGCGKSPEEARKELGQMNIQYTELSFLKAIENNDSVATKLFIEAGMDTNINVDGVTPLMVAATKNRLEIAKSLIEKKANVNAKAKDGMTALCLAIAGDSDGPGSIDFVKLLLEKGADVNVQTTVEKMTPIMIAVAKGDVGIVKELIGKGADVNLKADKGITALIVAKKMKKQEVIDILLQAGAKEDVAPQPVVTNQQNKSVGFMGTWSSSGQGRDLLIQVTNVAEGSLIASHDAAFGGGTRIDKKKNSIEGMINGKSVDVSWKSGYSKASGRATMTMLDDNRIQWRITSITTQGEHYLPQEAILVRQ